MTELVFFQAVIIIALQLRDYRTTLEAFKHEGAKETGPIASRLVDRLGLRRTTTLVKAAAIVVVLGLAVTYSLSPSPVIPVVFTVVLAFYAVTVYRNIKVKQKLKENSDAE